MFDFLNIWRIFNYGGYRDRPFNSSNYRCLTHFLEITHIVIENTLTRPKCARHIKCLIITPCGVSQRSSPLDRKIYIYISPFNCQIGEILIFEYFPVFETLFFFTSVERKSVQIINCLFVARIQTV